jgi:hypothetical protein
MLGITLLGYSTESLGVIHNDFVGQNIILTRGGEMVLIDFACALSRAANSEKARPKPELRIKRQHSHIYGRLVDCTGVFPAGKWIREALVESNTNPGMREWLGEDWRTFLKQLPFEEWEQLERDRLSIPQIEARSYSDEKEYENKAGDITWCIC